MLFKLFYCCFAICAAVVLSWGSLSCISADLWGAAVGPRLTSDWLKFVLMCLLTCILCAPDVCSAHGGQKKTLTFLGLELQTVMNNQVDARVSF